MPNQITNYKCPACTGPLHFVGETGRVECDYCGSSYSVDEIEALYAGKDEAAAENGHKDEETPPPNGEEWDVSGLSNDWGADGANMKVYNCPSCGAELMCEATTAATSCPYCGNPTIVPGQLSGALKPDYVIPFKLDKNAAMEALKGFYKGKKLLPGTFAKSNHIQEIKGVYVPFWLFDGEADVDAHFEATRTHARETGNERIITTEHFDLHRAGTVKFERIPVDAASKMPDDYMDAIEPFDYSELKTFSTAYLPGYFADKYDVSVEESAERADTRAVNTAYGAMQSTCIGYETVMLTNGSSANLHRGAVKYALMPVWMLNTKWNGQDFLFAMNGQTGKLIGNLPVDKGKYWKWFIGVAAVVAAVAAPILMFLL